MELKEYNACVKQWADALFRFACKCTGNEVDASDVVQGCFEVLWQKRDAVPAEKVKAFLFQVAYRQSVDVYRRNTKITYPEYVTEKERIDPASYDIKRVLEKALDRLDEQARALILLKDYEGYRYEEIAQITGLSDSQVKVYLHRARKILKDYLVSIEHVL